MSAAAPTISLPVCAELVHHPQLAPLLQHLTAQLAGSTGTLALWQAVFELASSADLRAHLLSVAPIDLFDQLALQLVQAPTASATQQQLGLVFSQLAQPVLDVDIPCLLALNTPTSNVLDFLDMLLVRLYVGVSTVVCGRPCVLTRPWIVGADYAGVPPSRRGMTAPRRRA